MEKVFQNSHVDLPSLLIEEGMEERMGRLEEELKKKKVSLASYLKEQNMTEEEINKLFKKQVEFELKMLLIFDKIAQEEHIEVTEEEVDKRLELLAQGEDRPMKAKKFKEELVRKRNLGSFIQRMRNEKIIDFLYNQAEIS